MDYTLSLEAEKELMMQVASGNESATRKLTADYLDYVVSLAFRVVGNRHDAEEIAQEVFVKLFDQAGRWESRARISTWLYRVAYNTSIDCLRSRKRHSTCELNEFLIPGKKMELDFLPEEVKSLEVAMSQLSVSHRSALTIFYFQEKKIREAAEIMSLKEDAFESLLRRARKKLKNILEDMDVYGKEDEPKKEESPIYRKGGSDASQVPLLY